MGRGYVTVAIRRTMGYPAKGYVPMRIRKPMSANQNNMNTQQKFDMILSEAYHDRRWLDNESFYGPEINSNILSNEEKEQFKKYVFDNLNNLPGIWTSKNFLANYMPEKTKQAMKLIGGWTDTDIYNRHYPNLYDKNGRFITNHVSNGWKVWDEVKKKYPLSMKYEWRMPSKNDMTRWAKYDKKLEIIQKFKNAVKELEENEHPLDYAEKYWKNYKKKRGLYYKGELEEKGITPDENQIRRLPAWLKNSPNHPAHTDGIFR
jgi:hypothetical protein